MQRIYLFIIVVYRTEDTTSGYETTHEFTRLSYNIGNVYAFIKSFSTTIQTSVPQTTATENGNLTSLCFENVESSRVDEDKIILKDPGRGNKFDHFKLLFGGIGSFTYRYESYEM